MAEVEEAFDVFFAHRWEDEWADYREADLSAVSMAGEHHVDEWEAGVFDNGVDEVGFVAHEEYRGVGHRWDGEIQVAGGGSGIAGSGEPEVVAAALNGNVAVYEHGRAVGFEHVDDLLGAYGDVVIAEDGVALRGFEGGENFGADAGGFEREGWIAGAAAAEIAGEEDEFGVEGVDVGDGLLEEGRLGVLLEVDVGELGHAEALEGVRQVFDGEGAWDDAELVASVKARVGGQAEACCSAADDETPAGYGVGILALNAHRATRHSP